MPVALLNEIVLAVVGFIIGYKFNKNLNKVTSFFNRIRGVQDV